MIVQGIEVSEEIVAKTVSSMRVCDRFTFLIMETQLIQHGCDKQVAYRAADRVLQRLRKSGDLAFRKGAWEWTK